MAILVAAVGFSKETANTTNHDWVMPAGIASGDLLCGVTSLDGGNDPLSGFPAGWVVMINTDANTIAYKFAAGTETNFVVTTASNEKSLTRVFRITGAHATTPPERSTRASGTSTAPLANALTPSWGAEATMWIAFEGVGTVPPEALVTAYPTNYTDNQFTDSTGTASSDQCMGIATRIATVATETPGAFTIATSAPWQADLIAIRPAAAGGGGRIMSSLAGAGGLVGRGGIAGPGGGLAG